MRHVVQLSLVATLGLCLPVSANTLFYKAGPTPNNPDMHTIVYTDKVGSTPVKGGTIEINGQSITVYGQSDEVSERNVLLNGQLVKTRLRSDQLGSHLNCIAYFIDGSLLQGRSRTRQNEIIFLEGGFVSGKIDSFTSDAVLVNDHGSPRSIQLSTVLAIRSPRVYNLQIDLNADQSSSKPEREYTITSCSLKESMPSQMISSQSIAPKAADDDDLDNFDDVRNDMLLDSSLSTPSNTRLGL